MAKVKKELHLSIPDGREITTLVFDADIPLGEWRHVEIGGKKYKPADGSMQSRNMLSFMDYIDAVGAEVEFVK